MKTVLPLMRESPGSLEHRKPREDHLHVNAGIESRSVGVGDVLVLVADCEAAAVGVGELDAAAEIKGEVEKSGGGQRDLFVEVEEASGGLTEWVHAASAAGNEIQNHGGRNPPG